MTPIVLVICVVELVLIWTWPVTLMEGVSDKGSTLIKRGDGVYVFEERGEVG